MVRASLWLDKHRETADGGLAPRDTTVTGRFVEDGGDGLAWVQIPHDGPENIVAVPASPGVYAPGALVAVTLSTRGVPLGMTPPLHLPQDEDPVGVGDEGRQTLADRAAIAAGQARLDNLGAEIIESGQTLAERLAAISASADGKTRTTPALTPPVGSGESLGDLWFQFADETLAVIVGTWTWTGTEWLSGKAGHEVIGSVDIGTLTVVGEARLKAAVIEMLWVDVVRSRKLTTDMLLVGSGLNLVPNGAGELGSNAGWGDLTWDPVDKPDALPGAFWCAPGQSTLNLTTATNGSEWLPLTPGEYHVEYWVRADKAGSRLYIALTDQDGAHAASSSGPADDGGVNAGTGPYLATNLPVPTVWTRYSKVITVSSTVFKARLGNLFFNHANGTERGARVGIAGLRIRARTGASLVVDGGILARSIDILSLTAAAAFIERVRALGIILTDADGEITVNLSGPGPHHFQLYGEGGEVVASISQSGRVFGKQITAQDSLIYRGTELQTTLDQGPRGLVAWAQFNGTQLPSKSSDGEIGLFELAWRPDPTRMYEVSVSPFMLYATLGPGTVGIVVRYTVNGAAPTISSPILGYSWVRLDTGGTYATVSFGPRLVAGLNGPHVRVLVCLAKSVPSGGTVSISPAGGENAVVASVQDIGPLMPAVGQISAGGGVPGTGTAPPPPVNPIARYTRDFASTWARSYQTSGAPVTSGMVGWTEAAQGKSPYVNQNLSSHVGFDTTAIQAALAGASIVSCQVYVYAQHWHANSGGTARFHTHPWSSAPAVFGTSHVHRGDVAMGKPQGLWVDLGALVGQGFRDAQIGGISFSARGSTSSSYYGHFSVQGDSRPVLRVVYEK